MAGKYKVKLAKNDNPQVDKKLRRQALSCPRCKPHRGENRKKQPREDRSKNKRRS